MGCDEIKKIIPAYIQHSATEDEMHKVEEHLCVCNECREYLGQTMDRPVKPIIPEEKREILPEIPMTSNSNKMEYAMLAVGVVILLFFVFLLLKR